MALTALEVVVATAVASLGVALLETSRRAVGLGVVYLLAVAFVAFRRGEVPALATAVLSVLVFNFLFIEPRYRLAISQSDDLVALAVFLVVASVVSRLAATARARAEEAQARAQEAERHERVAQLLAEAASSLLAGGPVEQELASERSRLGAAFARAGLRVSLSPVPAPRSGELSTSLKTSTRSGWLYGDSASRLGQGCPRAALRAAAAAVRSRAGARAGGRAVGGGGGGNPCGCREDGGAACDLARPALAVDRDHDGAHRPARLRARARPRRAPVGARRGDASG